MTKVFIDGSEGTTGLRIFERFEKRDDIELLKIPSELRKDPTEISKYINASDITFLCLPDDAAREAVSLCNNADTVIIDTSTAHRTNPDWAYGFPELSKAHRDKIKTSKRIAVPGCYATGFISLVYPLVQAGILPKDYPIACFAASGYSGGGKKLIAQYEDEARDKKFSSARMYGWTQNHKHLKEMKAITGIDAEPLFSPFTADYYSGMIVQVPLQVSHLSKKVTPADVRECFAKHYEGEKFIHVLPLGVEADCGNTFFSSEMSGRDDFNIFVTGNDDRIVVASSFDNLGKGASGAAIQCMNISIGADEAKGLNI